MVRVTMGSPSYGNDPVKDDTISITHFISTPNGNTDSLVKQGAGFYSDIEAVGSEAAYFPLTGGYIEIAYVKPAVRVRRRKA